MLLKYPSTGHWPWSQTIQKDDSYHPDPSFFLNKKIVITEKIDGQNVLINNGQSYARSVLLPATHGWFAMINKYYKWKTVDDPLTYHLEDIYGIHSIEYNPVEEDKTAFLFAIHNNIRWFSWSEIEEAALLFGWNTTPVLYSGTFTSVKEITNFFEKHISEPSLLGPIKEGFVLRT